MARKAKSAKAQTAPYKHPEAKSLMRPEVGTQAQFKKKKSPKTYRYDSSLSPALDWDAKNPAREQGEQQLSVISSQLSELRTKLAATDNLQLATENLSQAEEALRKLKALSKPFLNWAGKAERLSFEVPTLPLFIHERLSTKAIIETLAGHKTDKQEDMFALFGDPQHSITDQVLKAYEYQDNWTNRMVLGDSLVVMNSLLHYEGLGGQVQMIYMDPPYGVKFGSNFQPFVRKRDVSHNDDEDMTREPEMVQAYRDTWELGLHSYLTYLRDRLLLARDLLAPNGSIFLQISDENLHHVREVMDETFGSANFCGLIAFRTTGGQSTSLLSTSTDFLLWYSKDKELAKGKFHTPTVPKVGGADDGSGQYTMVEPLDFSSEPRQMTDDELDGKDPIPPGWRILAHDTLYSQGAPSDPTDVEFKWGGQLYRCPANSHWKPGVKSGGMSRLAAANRIMLVGNTLRYKRYLSDYPVYELDNIWNDTARSGFSRKKQYVVETSTKVVERCLHMTTDPGDLVLDPTCGSGTTAYVAEQWGRRWITIDTSRVPLALARQRLLTATFPWHELKDNHRGPADGFTYKRKQNKKGEEVGGIVPHITLSSIANNEPQAEEVLVDRPEVENGITRVSGPFCVEATIPTPVDWEGDGIEDSGVVPEEAYGSFVDRMLEVLRKSPVLRLEGNKTVAFKNVRPPAKSLSLSAEALVSNGQDKAVALVFGPENGAVSEKLVYEAAREAHAKNYAHLYVIGFAIQPNARTLVEKCAEVMGVPATYVQATPDLMMGDLLKNMRSSQIFSVCGQPEITVHRTKQKQYQVELLGLDVFDPITMDVTHRSGEDVPAWFLDTDYNDLCFHVSQAFFPRTSAWDNLKKALKGEYEESVWDHLSGTTSAPFEAGEHKQIAVKVIDDRGNELLVVKKL
jgi:adenine-specific DNA-methyltransferase